MRVLVHGAGVAGHRRMRGAAIGLAHRGHELAWLGKGGEDAAREAPIHDLGGGAGRLAGFRADVVLGAGSPWGPVWRGWLAGAGVLVQAVAADQVAEWSGFERWAWGSLPAFALIEAEEAERVRTSPGLLVLDRVGLWSDAPELPAGEPEHPDCEILERACERALAGHRGGTARPAAFLDRDGTLIHDPGYLSDPAELRVLPGVAMALARLKGAGFALVVISNQAGVARGILTLRRAHEVMGALRRRLREGGVELDAIYFCPHGPDQGCACRKPGTELIERAMEDLRLLVRGSAMIGDKALDLETARNAGCLAVLVRTGYGAEVERELAASGASGADFIGDDLAAAAGWLLARIPTDA